MARLLIDLSPLRISRDFRQLFIGQLVSGLGDQITVVAVGYEVFRLTHSSLQVGLVSIAQLVPLLAVSILGGPLVDLIDRRRLLIWCFVCAGLASGAITLDALRAHPALWPFYVFTALEAGFSALTKPSQNAAIPSMVRPEKLTAAFGVRQIMFQVGNVVGPGLAGIVIAQFDVGIAFALDTASFFVAALASASITAQPPIHSDRPNGMHALREGLRYVISARILQGIFLADLAAMVFGLPRALFPALAINHFHAGATGLGALYSAVGIGSFIAALTSGWLSHVSRQGRWVLIAVLTWGASMIGFGVVAGLALGAVFLGIAGYADVVSAIMRASMLQTVAPPAMRGRLSAIQTAVVTGGPRLGDLESGAVAGAIGVEGSVITGGIVCIIAVLVVAWRLPSFARYRLLVPHKEPDSARSTEDDRDHEEHEHDG
ncbi:MAG: MFS transporter [Acidimicrobiales bacterium]